MLREHIILVYYLLMSCPGPALPFLALPCPSLSPVVLMNTITIQQYYYYYYYYYYPALQPLSCPICDSMLLW
jgi:hypothetical protein